MAKSKFSSLAPTISIYASDLIKIQLVYSDTHLNSMNLTNNQTFKKKNLTNDQHTCQTQAQHLVGFLTEFFIINLN